MKSMMIVAVVSGFAFTLNAQSVDGKELFVKKCATCHSLTIPQDKSKMKAPPARGVMFHMREAFGSDEKIKAHILDFVIEPSREKAICKSVKRFGVMPSLKGKVSQDELSVIADWMIKNLQMNQAEHQKMQGK